MGSGGGMGAGLGAWEWVHRSGAGMSVCREKRKRAGFESRGGGSVEIKCGWDRG